MIVQVHLKGTSNTIDYKDVINAYIKCELYCIMFRDKKTGQTVVHKYPMADVFRIVEI